jgi:hypothetical protein
MSTKTCTGLPLQGNPRKCSEPSVNWFEFILKIAERCATQHRLKRKARWRKYDARHYWEVIVYGVLNCLGTEDAAEQWNAIKWQELNDHGHRKQVPGRLGGVHPRHERFAPDRSQVNAYKRQFSHQKVMQFQMLVFQEQLKLAIELGVVKKTIDVFVDFTDKPFYGALKSNENEYFHFVRNKPGTKSGRKFFGVMIRSGQARLFSHLVLASRMTRHAEYVNQAIDDLRMLGFIIHRIAGDAAFVIRGILEKCNSINSHYVGPVKKNQNLKEIIKQFLMNQGPLMVPYLFKGGRQRQKSNPLQVWIFLHTKEQIGLNGIRRKFQEGKLTLKKAMKMIRPFISTKCLHVASRFVHIACTRLVNWYKMRWWIETAFRDLNDLIPEPHTRNHASAEFSMLLRVWMYNAWQIHRAMTQPDIRKRQVCQVVKISS